MSIRERTEDDAAVLDVRIRFIPTLPLVRLAGELDLDSAHQLTEAVHALAVNHCPGDLVVLDLAAVRFCDVAGLRAIEWCASALAGSGKQLVLYHPPAAVTRLIAVTGIAAGVTIR